MSGSVRRAVAEQVLAASYRVVVTARRVADIVATHGEAALGLALDVTEDRVIDVP